MCDIYINEYPNKLEKR